MTKFKINKILVPVDFSETSDHAFKEAALFAQTNNAEICLLYVITKEPDVDTTAPIEIGETFYGKVTSQVSERLDKMISENSDIHITKAVKHGNVYKEICDKSYHEKFDLIVMGTHGRSGINEFFSGSNAYRVVSHASCPVITVRNKAKINGFKNIILPIRLEFNSRQKVDYIYEVAKLFDSTVFIAGYTKNKDEDWQYKIKQYVDQVEKYLGELGVKCKTACLFESNFTEAILNYADENKADLIAIMTTHDFSADQIFKGDYTQQLVNHSKIAVMSVPVYSDPDNTSYTPYLSGATYY